MNLKHNVKQQRICIVAAFFKHFFFKVIDELLNELDFDGYNQ